MTFAGNRRSMQWDDKKGDVNLTSLSEPSSLPPPISREYSGILVRRN